MAPEVLSFGELCRRAGQAVEVPHQRGTESGRFPDPGQMPGPGQDGPGDVRQRLLQGVHRRSGPDVVSAVDDQDRNWQGLAGGYQLVLSPGPAEFGV